MAAYQLNKCGVRRTADGINIPSSLTNADWQTYLAWVAAGGVPDPIKVDVVDTPAITAQQALMNDPAFRGLVKVLAAQFSMTVPQLVAAIKAAA